jgi:hypothetical protein
MIQMSIDEISDDTLWTTGTTATVAPALRACNLRQASRIASNNTTKPVAGIRAEILQREKQG